VPPAPRVQSELVGDALNALAERLSLRVVDGPTTYIALVADELENASVPDALGAYLVGVVAGAVNEDARLSVELLARTPDSVAEVRAHVLARIGEDNTFDSDARRLFRDTTRNPWIAEMVAHALLVLRRRAVTPCLEGNVEALKQPHADPRRQGLDLVAIYSDSERQAGLALGEAKASRGHGPARLNEAARFFSDIDQGQRGVEIRQEVSALKHVLTDELRATLADGFWRDRCCYLPLIVHCDPAIDEVADHVLLALLKPPMESRRLFSFRLASFHEFFDRTADGARAALDELGADV
jgi:hypothetical protein